MEGLNIHENFDIDLFNRDNSGIIEYEKRFNTANGQGSFKKFIFKDIYVCYGDIRLSKDFFVGITFPVPVIEMYFSILGNSILKTEKNYVYPFLGNQHNLIFCPDKQYRIGSPDERETSYTFHIIFPEQYFLNLVNKAYPILNSFTTEMTESQFTMLAKNNMPIVPEMNSILQEMMNCKRKGMLKTLFMEAKIIKLIMLQLEQFEQLEHSATNWLKNHDIEKLHYIKTVLDGNMSRSFSIMELSREAGINDFKLKKGFKEIFGTTVFGYLKDIRMLQAKKMLLENNKPIADIAMMCGYKFVQNFTKAFKKEFGTTPDKFRS